MTALDLELRQLGEFRIEGLNSLIQCDLLTSTRYLRYFKEIHHMKYLKRFQVF
jgi:hypothetical protein